MGWVGGGGGGGSDGWPARIVSAHLASTGAMAGLIWFVQVVHYPLLHEVGAGEFARYEALHTRLTGYVVGPLMAAETLTAASLARSGAPGGRRAMPLTGLGVLLGIHATTAFLSVPAHRRLSRGYDARTVDRLVATNWLRTAGWTVRTGLALAMAAASHD